MLFLSPPFVSSLAVFAWIWPRQDAVRHLLILALWSLIVAHVSLKGFRKIPFTCSFQPGKSAIHMRLLGVVGAILALGKAAAYEQQALHNDSRYAQAVAVLAILAFGAIRLGLTNPAGADMIVEFEDERSPMLQSLGLYRDGVIPS